MKTKIVKLVITAPIPPGATATDVKEFVEDAISWGGGCRLPEDPMSDSLPNAKIIFGRKNRK